jgi:hypothetical protein
MQLRLNRLAGLWSVEADYWPKVESKLFFEGCRATRAISNFWVLLALATVLATYGILSDSAATVVGAMLIAPLMTPILATSAALVVGDLQRATRSVLFVTAGGLGVILLSLALSVWMPSIAISFSANQEITSRVSPGLSATRAAAVKQRDEHGGRRQACASPVANEGVGLERRAAREVAYGREAASGLR